VNAPLNATEYKAALRSDFYSFMLRCFTDLNAGAAYMPSWHIEVMAAKLQNVRDGRVRRLDPVPIRGPKRTCRNSKSVRKRGRLPQRSRRR
jgi:hypothetical protein